eukprot:TRINITY_DN3619_c0_g1_i11.p1 TRINITY_DN3619_c0_g1~~TRINITY_DN3619_c0_g1_i11.p1  ORF type:complete len:1206 (-),score=200.47 TRINITY_DN3619_c0_g1_i11:736-4353(-)
MRDAGKTVDVVCLTETWAKPFCSIDPPKGYKVHDLPRPGKRDGGRVGGGLAVMVREGSFKSVEVVQKSRDGTRLWVRLGGGSEEKDFYLGLCYLPPVGSEFFRTFCLSEETFLQELTEEVANFIHRGDVMVSGDFNARVGEEMDFMSLEVGDTIEGVIDENWSGVATRVSQDKIVNARGRQFLEFCMTTGLGIINGRAKGDSLGAFTCGTGNGNSVVDYMLVDFNLWGRVEAMVVMEAGFESDHRPMLLSVIKSAMEHKETASCGWEERGLVIDERRWEQYKSAVRRRAGTLREVEEGKYGAVKGAELLHQAVLEAAQSVFARRRSVAKRSFPANGWYDEECKQAKRTLRELIRGMGPSSNLVKEMEKRYRSIVRRKKRGWSEGRTACLVELAQRCPTKFWKSFKPKRVKVGVASKETWEKYCQQLYGDGNRGAARGREGEIGVGGEEALERAEGAGGGGRGRRQIRVERGGEEGGREGGDGRGEEEKREGGDGRRNEVGRVGEEERREDEDGGQARVRRRGGERREGGCGGQAWVGRGGGGERREGEGDGGRGRGQELNAEFTTEEVKAAVTKLKMKKAADRDSLKVELLRLGVLDLLLGPMTTVFNQLFKEGAFPTSWNVGLLHPIFKKGDMSECSNYRTVTIVSLFGKVYATLLEKRLAEWAERHGIRARGQAGFRKGFGTAQHLFMLRVLTDKVRGKAWKKLYCAFVDFSKAFDTIPRDMLWKRLGEVGIEGSMLHSLQAMYQNVACQVVTPEGLTNPFPSSMGVKQGCPLSPLLFGIYIDNLESHLSNVDTHPPKLQGQDIPLLMFADDVVLMSNKREGLQKALDGLSVYCDCWKLRVNLEKTKVVAFGASLKRELRDSPFLYKGVEVEIVEKYRYLGIDFHANKRFTPTVKELCSKARRASFALQQRCGELGLRDPHMKIRLFDALVTPISHYGCEAWCPGILQRDDDANADMPEKLHRTFLRTILGVRQSTPSAALLGEFGRWPLLFSRWKQCISFYNKISEMNNDRFVKLALLEAKEDFLRGDSSWFALFKRGIHLLSDCRVDFEEDAFVKVDVGSFMAAAQERYIAKMRAETGTKVKMYTDIKIGYERENYLGRMPFTPGLRALAKFRCGSHDLEVERGRHSNPFVSRELRLCKLCNMGKVEDEVHFLFECPLYYEIRGRYHFLFRYADRDVCKFLNHPERDVVGHYFLDCYQLRY